MVKNIDQCFPQHEMKPLNVSFCQQPKENQFPVIEEKRNQKIFICKKRKILKIIN